MLLNSGRKRFPVSSTITTRSKFFKRINDKPVMINVGLISAAEDNELSLVRGSKLPVQVRKWFDADQVLKSAVKKHADHDQHFCDIENYCLMYPDMKIVDVVPGTQQIYCSKIQGWTVKTILEDRPVFIQSSQGWKKLYIWELVWRGHQSKCYLWQHNFYWKVFPYHIN